MLLDHSLSFRKTITPWYDSNFSCWLLIAVMILVFAFAMVGVFISSQTPILQEHVWFPGLLAFLSLFLVVKIFFRVRRRSKND